MSDYALELAGIEKVYKRGTPGEVAVLRGATLEVKRGEVVALMGRNHPFGIVDGLALGHLGLRLRGNVQILTHSVLCQPAEIAPHLLPIDFSGTAEARRASAQSRKLAMDLLAAGKVVAIFPAGGISTASTANEKTIWRPSAPIRSSSRITALNHSVPTKTRRSGEMMSCTE